MSAGQIPTPLTTSGRYSIAVLRLNGAEHYQAHTALGLATALADPKKMPPAVRAAEGGEIPIV